MNWFYALGGQQQGPVDDARLEALTAAGTINPDTLVWREGMANWQPLRQARPVPAATPAMAAPPVMAPAGVAQPLGADEASCTECGNRFTKDNLIQYGNAFVCATCKPVFLQKLREGASVAPVFSGLVTEEELLGRDYRIEIGDCLGRAWNIFTTNPGLLLGTSLLVGLVYFGAMMVVGVLGFVLPIINQLLAMMFTGPVMGGYLWFLLRLVRGEEATVGDAFTGFSRQFVQLMLSSLVQGLFSLLCTVPMIVLIVTGGILASVRGGGGSFRFSPELIAAMVGVGLFCMAGMVYLGTIWTHSLLLVADKGYNFWPAMRLSWRLVRKRWWMTFLFLMVAGIISSLGVFACGFGLIVSMPLYFLMRVCFYDDNFRDLAKPIQAV